VLPTLAVVNRLFEVVNRLFEKVTNRKDCAPRLLSWAAECGRHRMAREISWARAVLAGYSRGIDAFMLLSGKRCLRFPSLARF
jgi:hypothetical protein